MIKDDSVELFLEKLASKASTPGGGSAAAVMAGTGAALCSMVANLTLGKEKYADVEPQMQELVNQADSARGRALEMINDDVRVFDQVMAAYGMAKASDEEKAERSAAIQESLKEATDVPLACAKLCAEIIALSRTAAELGNTNVISDAGVAVLAAHAALKSAALNVWINVGNIKDADFATDRAKQIEDLLASAQADTDAIFELVRGKL